MTPIDIYEVYVGNVGMAWNGNDAEQAKKEFDDCVKASKDGIGRVGGEPVTLFKNGEPISSHTPSD